MEIFVGHKLVDKSYKFAEDMIDGYQRGRKEKSRALAVEGKPRIDSNVDLQAAGRIAECAGCIAANLDPHTALDWGIKCDPGFDFKINEITVDVKSSTHPFAKRLMWPISKIKFMDKAADILLFVRVNMAIRNRMGIAVDLVGWVTRDEFINGHRVATEFDKGIMNGTPYMTADDLHPVERMLL